MMRSTTKHAPRYLPVRIGKPVAVVRPKHADDVARVVDAARHTGMPLFVRSGAHHAAAHSTGDGLLIDLRSPNNIDIDVAGQTAWVETGLTAREVAWALEPHGLGWVRRHRERWHRRAYAGWRDRLPEPS